LVDKLGNLDAAVKFAAQKANLGKDYATVDYPTPEPWYLNIINQEKDNYYETKMRATLGEYYRPFMFLKTLTSRSYIQAHISFDPNIN
jgi:protease-4